MTGPIFIMATGQRCGSTLVQRFFNTHQDIMMWGEHGGFLIKVFKFVKMARRNEEEYNFLSFVSNNDTNYFIANMNPPSKNINFALAQLMENLWKKPANEFGKAIWGFKEVRYDYEMCLRLRSFFPNAKVIYLTRNILDCFISLKKWEKFGWDLNERIGFIGNWIRINESFLPVVHENLDWVFPLKYETLVSNREAIVSQLVSWLDLSVDSFDMEVFSHKIYTTGYSGLDKRPIIRKEDLTSEELSLLDTRQLISLHRQLQLEYPF